MELGAPRMGLVSERIVRDSNLLNTVSGSLRSDHRLLKLNALLRVDRDIHITCPFLIVMAPQTPSVIH